MFRRIGVTKGISHNGIQLSLQQHRAHTNTYTSIHTHTHTTNITWTHAYELMRRKWMFVVVVIANSERIRYIIIHTCIVVTTKLRTDTDNISGRLHRKSHSIQLMHAINKQQIFTFCIVQLSACLINELRILKYWIEIILYIIEQYFDYRSHLNDICVN